MATFVIGDVHGRSWLLDQLIRDVPWDLKKDKIIFLGDLIDRGDDTPGVIQRVMRIAEDNPDVIVVRGNHEQMMLDFFDFEDTQWLIPENGGMTTMLAYGIKEGDPSEEYAIDIPKGHIEFIRGFPYYHEDDQAIYVHAGLDPEKHPSESDPDLLLWSRSIEFFRCYDGKLCFFGHTPTAYLPHNWNRRRYDIYIHGTCVGLDTSGDEESPLSCIRVESFTLYQAYPNGITEVDRLGPLKPVSKTVSGPEAGKSVAMDGAEI